MIRVSELGHSGPHRNVVKLNKGEISGLVRGEHLGRDDQAVSESNGYLIGRLDQMCSRHDLAVPGNNNAGAHAGKIGKTLVWAGQDPVVLGFNDHHGRLDSLEQTGECVCLGVRWRHHRAAHGRKN